MLTVALPVGHGAALHYPDQPWAKWHYIDGRNERIQRHNLPEFVQAAEMTCRAVRAYLAGREDFENQPGMPEDVRDALTKLLDTNRNLDDNKRLQTICEAVKTRRDSGIERVDSGLCAQRSGLLEVQGHRFAVRRRQRAISPRWSDVFEKSDYRRFHDAVKEHRFVTTQEILPAHGLRIA